MPIDNSTRFPKPLAADLRELSEGMAIVIDGDTAPKAIASGQYLFIKNHSTLATGGYHATAAIASGADITSSNVTADADGIVNGAVGALSEHLAKSTLGDLLWSHTGPLGATTISIPNLYTYNEIRVVWSDADSGDNRITYAVPISGTTFILFGIDIASDNDYGHAFNIRSRIGKFISGGIEWGNGQMIYYGGVYKDWTNRAVPKRIYGIKYT